MNSPPVNKNILYTCISAVSLFFMSCQEKVGSQSDSLSESQTEATTFKVVCTTGMISDIAKNIGGDKLAVINIIGEGVDPHVYKPTSNDVKALLSGDIVFYNGLHLEGQMGNVLAKVAAKGKPVYAVAESAVNEDALLHDEEGAHDPHVWMDVQQWSKVAAVISAKLSEALPDQAEVFQARAGTFHTSLVELDKFAANSVESIPVGQRELITAHDAFGYMASAYGLKVRGIQGISTESEAGLKDLEDLISYIKDKNIPAVFVESSVNDKNVKALIEGAKAQGHAVTIGGELFSDAMGEPGTFEGTYIGMIYHNISTITKALGGEISHEEEKEAMFKKLSTYGKE